MVGTAGSVLTPTVLSIAAGAHIFSVVLPAGVGALRDKHHLGRRCSFR